MTWKQIGELLRRLLIPSSFKKEHQWQTLLVSFLLALTLWFLATLNESYSTSLAIPVKIDQVPETIVPEMETRFDVTVDVKGSGLDLLLEQFRLSRDTVLLHFQDDWRNDVPVAMDIYRSDFLEVLPSRVSIEAFSPARLSFRYSNKTNLRVPLVLNTRFRLSAGYQLDAEPELQTDSVTIMGPQKLIETIERWYTVPGWKELSGQERSVQIAVVDTLEGLIVTPKSVMVHVNPRKYTELRLRRPVQVIDLPPSSRVQISHPFVDQICVVPLEEYDRLQRRYDGDTLYVSMNELSEYHTFWRPVPRGFPSSVKVIRSEPARIEINLIRRARQLEEIRL